MLIFSKPDFPSSGHDAEEEKTQNQATQHGTLCQSPVGLGDALCRTRGGPEGEREAPGAADAVGGVPGPLHEPPSASPAARSARRAARRPTRRFGSAALQPGRHLRLADPRHRRMIGRSVYLARSNQVVDIRRRHCVPCGTGRTIVEPMAGPAWFSTQRLRSAKSWMTTTQVMHLLMIRRVIVTLHCSHSPLSHSHSAIFSFSHVSMAQEQGVGWQVGSCNPEAAGWQTNS